MIRFCAVVPDTDFTSIHSHFFLGIFFINDAQYYKKKEKNFFSLYLSPLLSSDPLKPYIW